MHESKQTLKLRIHWNETFSIANVSVNVFILYFCLVFISRFIRTDFILLSLLHSESILFMWSASWTIVTQSHYLNMFAILLCRLQCLFSFFFSSELSPFNGYSCLFYSSTREHSRWLCLMRFFFLINSLLVIHVVVVFWWCLVCNLNDENIEIQFHTYRVLSHPHS